MPQQTAMVFSPGGAHPPEAVSAWLQSRGIAPVIVRHPDELMAGALRGRPRLVVFDARSDGEACATACARLKRDSYTGIVPALSGWWQARRAAPEKAATASPQPSAEAAR